VPLLRFHILHQADRFETNGKLPEDAYLTQLLADLDRRIYLMLLASDSNGIFIGGGTPSLMSEGLLLPVDWTLTRETHVGGQCRNYHGSPIRARP